MNCDLMIEGEPSLTNSHSPLTAAQRSRSDLPIHILHFACNRSTPRQGQQHSKDSDLAIALKGRHKEPAPIVSPLQGSESIYARTQGDDKARQARIVLPWADMFCPFGAHTLPLPIQLFRIAHSGFPGKPFVFVFHPSL